MPTTKTKIFTYSASIGTDRKIQEEMQVAEIVDGKLVIKKSVQRVNGKVVKSVKRIGEEANKKKEKKKVKKVKAKAKKSKK